MIEMIKELERLEAITSKFDENDESKEKEWLDAHEKELEISDKICKEIVKLSNNQIKYKTARRILSLHKNELISFFKDM